MKKIILLGGGGHCKSVIDVIEKENKYKIAGIIDKPEQLGKKVLKYKIIGNDTNLKDLKKKYNYALITIGFIKSPFMRIKLFNLAKKIGFKFPKIISPIAYVSPYSIIGDGTIIMHNAIVNANTKIGKNCIINSKALIEHDCLIFDNCHISTNVTINGCVKIGAKTFIGSNSVSKNNISIEEKSFIKAGSLIK